MAQTIFTYNNRIPTYSNGNHIIYDRCFGSDISLSGLQVYYKLDGNANDSSGNGNNGTETAMSYTTGNFNLAGIFSSAPTPSATGSRIVSPTKNYNVSTAYTVSAWFKTSSKADVMSIFSSDISTTSPVRCWQLRIDNSTGYIRFIRFNSGGSVVTNIAGSTDLATGNWTHVAAVFDNTVGSKVYINGLEVASDVVTTNNNSSASMVLQVGCLSLSTSSHQNWFIGNIDEAILFNRALSLSEVQILASSGCPLIS